MKINDIVNFIFELGQLKRQKHTGFYHAGVLNPSSVAEHAFRAAQIGYVLAVMEGDANPEKVAVMLMVHDNAETRIGDHNKITAKYIDRKNAEENAYADQLSLLGQEIAQKWHAYFSELEERKTKEGIIAKDADWLETAFQAKEYYDLGYKAAWDWIANVDKALETESAKKILAEMKNSEFTDYWKDLKKMTYEKLGE